jgi:hypothetical protein
MFDFHDGAKVSHINSADELLREVGEFSNPAAGKNSFQVHPSAIINQEEIIGEIKTVDREVDGAGNETGRFWRSEGRRFGWRGEEYRKLKRFAEKMAKARPLEGLVSETFILDLIFEWLCNTLDRKHEVSINDFVLTRSEAAIRDHEMWVPIYRTYSRESFQIGDVLFKPLTQEILDGWFPRNPLPDPEMDRRVRILEQQTRERYQGSLVACVNLRGEEKKVNDVALEKVLKATALLRYISLVNWIPEAKSSTMPFGMEQILSWANFNVEDGLIKGISQRVLDIFPDAWVIDDARRLLPGVLEALSDLALSQKSEFRKVLYDALLIYSRNSTTNDSADKLLFVLVALESLLVKDSSEPIQGNLAERMAFLAGASLDDRKLIVSIVKKTYGMRSKFVHHGRTLEDRATLEKFLEIAWNTFAVLINNRDVFTSRLDLINKLDERRLT